MGGCLTLRLRLRIPGKLAKLAGLCVCVWGGAVHTGVSSLCLYYKTFPASKSAWIFDSSCEEIKLSGTRVRSHQEEAKRGRQRQASIFRAQAGNPGCPPFLFCAHFPTFKCWVQEFKTNLPGDQEALGWGAWLGDDRAGPPGPSPTWSKKRKNHA